MFKANHALSNSAIVSKHEFISFWFYVEVTIVNSMKLRAKRGGDFFGQPKNTLGKEN